MSSTGGPSRAPRRPRPRTTGKKTASAAKRRITKPTPAQDPSARDPEDHKSPRPAPQPKGIKMAPKTSGQKTKVKKRPISASAKRPVRKPATTVAKKSVKATSPGVRPKVRPVSSRPKASGATKNVSSRPVSTPLCKKRPGTGVKKPPSAGTNGRRKKVTKKPVTAEQPVSPEQETKAPVKTDPAQSSHSSPQSSPAAGGKKLQSALKSTQDGAAEEVKGVVFSAEHQYQSAGNSEEDTASSQINTDTEPEDVPEPEPEAPLRPTEPARPAPALLPAGSPPPKPSYRRKSFKQKLLSKGRSTEELAHLVGTDNESRSEPAEHSEALVVTQDAQSEEDDDIPPPAPSTRRLSFYTAKQWRSEYDLDERLSSSDSDSDSDSDDSSSGSSSDDSAEIAPPPPSYNRKSFIVQSRKESDDAPPPPGYHRASFISAPLHDPSVQPDTIHTSDWRATAKKSSSRLRALEQHMSQHSLLTSEEAKNGPQAPREGSTTKQQDKRREVLPVDDEEQLIQQELNIIPALTKGDKAKLLSTFEVVFRPNYLHEVSFKGVRTVLRKMKYEKKLVDASMRKFAKDEYLDFAKYAEVMHRMMACISLARKMGQTILPQGKLRLRK